jgi:pimeloyl-ACP methyl ester carboxylesterase
VPDDGSPEAVALRHALKPSTLVEATTEPGGVTARLLPARAAVAAGDPVPRAGALGAPAWAVTAENGDLLMPLKQAGDEATIRENLEKVARYRHALAIENPDPDSALRGKFKLDLLRRSESGELTVAEPEVAGGQVVYEEGDAIVFRITSDYDKAVFMSLVDFGITGAVELILPFREGRSQRELGPGIQFEYETSPKKLFRLTWPGNFPFVDTVDHATEAEGVETVKLFITEQEADFSVLQQKGVRSLGGKASPLGDLLDSVFQGKGTRDIGRDAPIDADWTTVSRSFVVRRKATKELSSTGKAVELGGARLVTQGLSGTATTHFGRNGRKEAASLVSGGLHDALAAAGVEERQTVEVAAAQETGPATRSVGDQPAMELQLRDPGAGFGQMVMAADELGVVSWHVAAPSTAPATRGASAAPTRTYLIPRSVPSERPTAPGTRGIVSALGRKVLKELVFPLIDPIVGEIGAGFVNRMETKRWPYRVRTFQPDDFTSDAAREVTGADWTRLSRGRALLFVHGTFSRAHLAFGQLTPELLAELHRRYDGRVFAYDHFTLSHDPAENVKRFLAAMPSQVGLDVDIVCHSRGGLVSRMLVERLATFGADPRRFRVGRVVFVGSPNAGTPLASPTRTGDFVDVCTNVLDVLPDNGVTDVLTMIISVVKQLAVGVLGGLDGLQSMNPEGEFARQLNTGARSGEAKYFAITSNATPTEAGLKRLLVTKGLGKLMAGANDLVVPTEGVFRENGSGFFPIEDRLVLDGGEGVTHTHYFGNERVRRKMLEWLTA